MVPEEDSVPANFFGPLRELSQKMWVSQVVEWRNKQSALHVMRPVIAGPTLGGGQGVHHAPQDAAPVRQCRWLPAR